MSAVRFEQSAHQGSSFAEAPTAVSAIPGDPADGGCAQGDHYDSRSLVIEQEGRQRRARAEPFAAVARAVSGICFRSR